MKKGKPGRPRKGEEDHTVFNRVRVKKSEPLQVMNHLVDIFHLARSGMSNRQIGHACGVNWDTFKMWMETFPPVKTAIDQGRAPPGEGTKAFQDYVHDRLPHHLQDLWEAIQEVEKGTSTIDRVEAMLVDAGKRGRQHLFLYALVNSNFNASEACRQVNISYKTFTKWVTTDQDFSDLVDEIQWHKANFFESAFITLVKNGDPKAVLHAAKTFIANRGYGTPGKTKNVNVQVTGGAGKIALVTVDDLGLSIQERKKILEEYRKKKEAIALAEHKED